jgi:hypothetical protein
LSLAGPPELNFSVEVVEELIGSLRYSMPLASGLSQDLSDCVYINAVVLLALSPL